MAGVHVDYADDKTIRYLIISKLEEGPSNLADLVNALAYLKLNNSFSEIGAQLEYLTKRKRIYLENGNYNLPWYSPEKVKKWFSKINALSCAEF